METETVQALGAGTNFLLALAAFWTIWQNYSLRKSEKRERLLNETIDWVLDVAKPKYALSLMSLDYTFSEEDQTNIIQLSQASYTHLLIVRGKYIGKIALIFTQDLSTAVEYVRSNLEEHSKLIDDWIKDKNTAEVIGEHDYALDQSADKVIEEATKIKAGDVS